MNWLNPNNALKTSAAYKIYRKTFFHFPLQVVLFSLFLIGGIPQTKAQVTNINTNSSQPGAATVAAGATNVLLYYFTLNVTTAAPSFTSLSNFTTSGTYVAADILNLKLWVSNFEFFGGGSLVNIATINTTLGPGAHTFAFANPLPGVVAQRYFWVTTDISSTATCGNTITCDLMAAARFIITGTKNYGTNNPAGTQTINGGGCLGLPIGLLSFTGNNNGKENVLMWKTASETNNDYFTVERSVDAVHFESAGNVNGAGNSETTLSYSYTDELNLNSDKVLYYRLKQTDFDRKFSYSEIIKLNFVAGDKPPDIYFDVTSGLLTVSYNSNEEGEFIFEIVDLLGRSLLQKQLYAETKGKNVFTVLLSSIPDGIYFAKFSDLSGNIRSQFKFIE